MHSPQLNKPQTPTFCYTSLINGQAPSFIADDHFLAHLAVSTARLCDFFYDLDLGSVYRSFYFDKLVGRTARTCRDMRNIMTDGKGGVVVRKCRNIYRTYMWFTPGSRRKKLYNKAPNL